LEASYQIANNEGGTAAVNDDLHSAIAATRQQRKKIVANFGRELELKKEGNK
jgi:hypothetical protein